MASLEEAMMRLQALEDDRAAEKRTQLEDAFMSQYGSKFNNHRGLGVAILDELDRRGVDTSAADEAVQAVLDELRTQSQQLLDLIQNVQDQANQQADKINQIDDAVQSAAAGDPGSVMGGEPGDLPPAPPVELAISPEALGNISAGDSTGAVTSPEPPAPPAGDTPPAPPAGDTPPAPPTPPAGVTGAGAPPDTGMPQDVDFTASDARIKKIRQVVSDKRAKRVVKPAASEGFKPSAGMLAAAQGGLE